MKNNLSPIHILVVEDDLALLKVLNNYLNKSGATVFKASNGQEALKFIEEEKIDFVLSDVQMPIMGGVELLKKIRIKNPHIPIVLLTTGHAELTKENALEFGASGLIHKPFSLQALNDEIQRLLDGRNLLEKV